jgi:hypothetical protein
LTPVRVVDNERNLGPVAGRVIASHGDELVAMFGHDHDVLIVVDVG